MPTLNELEAAADAVFDSAVAEETGAETGTPPAGSPPAEAPAAPAAEPAPAPPAAVPVELEEAAPAAPVPAAAPSSDTAVYPEPFRRALEKFGGDLGKLAEHYWEVQKQNAQLTKPKEEPPAAPSPGAAPEAGLPVSEELRAIEYRIQSLAPEFDRVDQQVAKYRGSPDRPDQPGWIDQADAKLGELTEALLSLDPVVDADKYASAKAEFQRVRNLRSRWEADAVALESRRSIIVDRYRDLKFFRDRELRIERDRQALAQEIQIRSSAKEGEARRTEETRIDAALTSAGSQLPEGRFRARFRELALARLDNYVASHESDNGDGGILDDNRLSVIVSKALADVKEDLSHAEAEYTRRKADDNKIASATGSPGSAPKPGDAPPPPAPSKTRLRTVADLEAYEESIDLDELAR